MSPIALRADRRFHRAHVKPARRRNWRTLLRPAAKLAVLAAVVVYVAYHGTAVIARARVLQVARIVVKGNARMSTGEVLAILTGLNGQSLLWTDLDGWRQRLLASPWVRDASLRRSLPSTIEIAISEREPAVIGRIKDKLYLVDEQGVVIDEYGPQYADFDLPIVDGLSAGSPAGQVRADEARAELAARLLLSFQAKPELLKRLSQVDVADLHNASVILSGDPAVIFLGDDRFLQRVESYLELASALRDRVPDIDSVDLRFDDRIYVRPKGKPPKFGAARR